MRNQTVKFIDKEYSIPTDVLKYMAFFSFANTAKKRLLNTFLRKIKVNIAVIERKDFMEKEILDEANRFIAKLCENDIYDKTASDYLKDNQGYEFFHTVISEALNNIIAIYSARNEEYKSGIQSAVYKKEASVTGLDFGIISSSLVNHAVYAFMDASESHKQEQAAVNQYNKEIKDLRENVVSKYSAQERKYIETVFIPGIELAFTALYADWLDKFITDLVKNDKFDSNALKYIDLERSDDLLKNLKFASNKEPILENAFIACPFNAAVYMNAMKYDLLDYETFQTAKYFMQGDKIISFLEESLGEIAFPTKFKIDYHCADLLALFTDKKPMHLLRSRTELYAHGVVKAYSRVADMISDEKLCRKAMSEQDDNTILAGDGVSNGLSRFYLKIVTMSVWNELTQKCGHTDLLDKIKEFVPETVEAHTKDDVDNYLKEKLFASFEETRKTLVKEIEERKEAEEKRVALEAERMENERRIAEEKRKKAAKYTAVAIISLLVIVVACVSFKGATAEYQDWLTKQNIKRGSEFFGITANEAGHVTLSTEDYAFVTNDVRLFGHNGRIKNGFDEETLKIDTLNWTSNKEIELKNVIESLKQLYGNIYVIKPYFEHSDNAYMWKDVDMYQYVICWQNSDGTVTVQWMVDMSK